MANSLEKFFLSKLKQMPPVEFAMTPEQLRKPTNKKSTPVRGKVGGGAIKPGGASVIKAPPPGPSPPPIPTATPKASTEILPNNIKKPDLGS